MKYKIKTRICICCGTRRYVNEFNRRKRKCIFCQEIYKNRNICIICKMEKESKLFNKERPICKECEKNQIEKYRQIYPEVLDEFDTSSNNLYLNEYRSGYEGHHLYIENNRNFVIFIPRWIHLLWIHNSISSKSMNDINTIALDYWINEESYREDWK